MLRLSAARTFAALALFGCSAEPSSAPTALSREVIAGGELDRNRNEVVELITEIGGGVSLCTGILIAPNLVLTARHCVSGGGGENVRCGSSPLSAPVAGSNVHATTAVTPSQSSRFYDGRSVSVPAEGNDTCGFDLALVTLAENVPLDVARPAVPRIDVAAWVGEPYVAVGYGVDDRGDPTAGRMFLDGLVVRCAAGCGGFDVADTEFMGESGVCSGDSGGPALDAEGRVIGVLSRGSDPCETPVYGGVAGFRDWIMATALSAADSGGYEPPFWALTGTSDRPPGVEGDPCLNGADCGDGSVCYYESDPLVAFCTRPCAVESDCNERSACVSGFEVPGGGLCLARRVPRSDGDPPKRSSEGACSVGGGRRAPASTALVLASLAVLLLWKRRRQNSKTASRPRTSRWGNESSNEHSCRSPRIRPSQLRLGAGRADG
jgi:V8-like Glu-specific endopeptidase